MIMLKFCKTSLNFVCIGITWNMGIQSLYGSPVLTGFNWLKVAVPLKREIFVVFHQLYRIFSFQLMLVVLSFEYIQWHDIKDWKKLKFLCKKPYMLCWDIRTLALRTIKKHIYLFLFNVIFIKYSRIFRINAVSLTLIKPKKIINNII